MRRRSTALSTDVDISLLTGRAAILDRFFRGEVHRPRPHRDLRRLMLGPVRTGASRVVCRHGNSFAIERLTCKNARRLYFAGTRRSPQDFATTIFRGPVGHMERR
jgi:hypothetical protein